MGRPTTDKLLVRLTPSTSRLRLHAKLEPSASVHGAAGGVALPKLPSLKL